MYASVPVMFLAVFSVLAVLLGCVYESANMGTSHNQGDDEEMTNKYRSLFLPPSLLPSPMTDLAAFNAAAFCLLVVFFACGFSHTKIFALFSAVFLPAEKPRSLGE